MLVDYKFNNLSESDLLQGATYIGGSSNNPMKDDPISKIFKIEGCKKGIGNQGGFRKTSKENNGNSIKNTFAFVVLVDSGKQSEWPNSYDEKNRIFTYFGDYRKPGNDIHKTKNKGNIFLKEIFEKSYGGIEDRKTIPPIFIFKATGTRCDKEFIGLAIPGVKGLSLDEALEKKEFNIGEEVFENYVAKFTVLNIKEKIKREWLKQLKDYDIEIGADAPEEWNKFIIYGLEDEKTYDIYNGQDELEIINEVYYDGVSERQGKIKVRITQGKFRQNLIQRDKCCKVCGIDIGNLLIASHIKPWCDSNDFEKNDAYNGILLCSNHDALFDKGLISFYDDGKIIISKCLNENYYDRLNINHNIKIKISEKQRAYMSYHRENI